MDAEPVIEEGWIATGVAAELPELRLRWIDMPGGQGRSTPEIRRRLRLLSSRFHGAQAITIRRSPVPHAYRAFFRAIGLDPDVDRTPVEAAALDRLVAGGYTPRDRLQDALLLALVETGVPLWALDADLVDGPLGICEARAGQRLGRGEYADDIAPRRLVVADAAGPVSILFGASAPAHAVSDRTTVVRIHTVQVQGVPDLHVEEALWACAEALDPG